MEIIDNITGVYQDIVASVLEQVSRVHFYGVLRDGDAWAVLGYGADPVRPVTGILARYATLLEANADVARRGVHHA